MIKSKLVSTLLYIEWLDAGTITHGDWLSYGEIVEEMQPEKFMNKTIGWVLQDDDHGIVLTAQVAMNPTEPMYDLVMFVPKALIRKRKVLKA